MANSSLQELVNKFVADVQSLNTTGGDTSPIPTVETVVHYDEETGWFYNTTTGAPRSKGVDELRQELYDKGYEVIADQIPKFHCIAYWLKQQFPKTVFLNIDKVKGALEDFGTFAPIVEDDVEDTLVDNIIWQTKSVLGTVINTNRDYPKTEYRGQYGQNGFVKVVWDAGYAQPDFSPNLPPNYRELVGSGAIQRPGAQAFQQFKRRFDTFGFNSAPIPGTERTDHYVYNIWWDGVTDDDVTRFWRNWAVAVGAKIEL